MLNGETRSKLVEVMTSAVQEMLVAVRDVNSTRGAHEGAPRSEMAAHRSGFKAVMYLFAICIQVAEKNVKGAPLTAAVAKGKKVGVRCGGGEAREIDPTRPPPLNAGRGLKETRQAHGGRSAG